MKKLLLLGAAIAMLSGCGVADSLTDKCHRNGGDMVHLCKVLFGDASPRINDLDRRTDREIGRLEQLIKNNLALIQSLFQITQEQGDKIDANEVEIAKNLALIQALTSVVEQNELAVASNLALIEGLEQDLLLLQDDVEANELAIADLQSQIDALESQVLQNETNITSNLALIATLQAAMADQSTQLDNQNTTINSLVTTTNNLIADLAELQGYEHIVEFIDPCPFQTAPSGFNEVLLKTSSGQYVAYFESGGNRYLTLLKDNTNYMTTDGRGCAFSLANGYLVSQVVFPASRERPSGDFVTSALNNVKSIVVPVSGQITNTQTNFNPKDLWHRIDADSVSICYQAGNGAASHARVTQFKFAITDMVGDCAANAGAATEFLPGDTIYTGSVMISLRNSGKVGSTHVTTTSTMTIEVTR